jgi:hypothetical protein
MGRLTKEDATGWYRDQSGHEWHCVATETSMVCNSPEFFTSAYHETFARWGWKKIDGPSSPDQGAKR